MVTQEHKQFRDKKDKPFMTSLSLAAEGPSQRIPAAAPGIEFCMAPGSYHWPLEVSKLARLGGSGVGGWLMQVWVSQMSCTAWPNKCIEKGQILQHSVGRGRRIRSLRPADWKPAEEEAT